MQEKVNQFWELLSLSGLLSINSAKELKAEFSSEKLYDTEANDLDSLTAWLASKGAITEYQASVLANGQPTDFRYGDYRLLECIDNSRAEFLAQHSSGYCVVLKFLKGTNQDDALRWRSVRMRGETIAFCDSPHLLACFQTVKLAQHRMLVCEVPAGKQLKTMLPAKSRIPSDQVFAIGLRLAQAVQQLHDAGVTHKAISPATVMLVSETETRLAVDPLYIDAQWLGTQDEELQAEVLNFRAPEIKISQEATLAFEFETAVTQSSAAADMYSIGGLLFRMSAGKNVGDVPPNQIGDTLQQRDFPNWFVETIENLIGEDPEERMSATDLVAALETNGVKPSDEDSIANDLKTDFRQTISKLLPIEPVEELEAPQLGDSREPIAKINEPIALAADESLAEDPLDADERIAKAQASIQRRQRLKWLQPVLVVAGCLALGSIFAAVYSYGTKPQTSQSSQSVSPNKQPDKTVRSLPPLAAKNESDVALDIPPVIQTLISDDGSTLWETPTLGPPIDLDYLPPAPKIILHANPSQLLGKVEGQRLLRAMGQPFETLLAKFENSLGIPLANVDRLLLSFHQTEQNQYHWFAVVSCSLPKEQLKAAWGDLTIAKSLNDDTIFEGDSGLSYFFVDDDTKNDAATDPNSTTDVPPADEQLVNRPVQFNRPVKFLVGQNEFVQSVADLGFGYPISGPIKALQKSSDEQRDLNLIFLRPSLFNDQGQNWMGGNLSDFNRQLSELIPDEVSGGILSFHADSGDYFEVTLDRRVDIKAEELETRIQTGISQRLQTLVGLTERIPPNEHWQALQNRFGEMLSSVTRDFRWASGGRQLTGNVWLPPMASHNIIATSELVAAFQRTAVDPDAPQQQVPQSLAALLQAKRDLDIANPPDLNVLLADLEQEIDGDYSSLPFQWRIVLLGADLEKDGITKNQRPGPLKLEQKSFAEILTSIVVSANPDKNITGAADPNCKLIWVVAQDPENADQQAILITTRAAAAEKSYQLPDPFVN